MAGHQLAHTSGLALAEVVLILSETIAADPPEETPAKLTLLSEPVFSAGARWTVGGRVGEDGSPAGVARWQSSSLPSW